MRVTSSSLTKRGTTAAQPGKNAVMGLFALMALVIIGFEPFGRGDAQGTRLTGDGDILRQISYTALFLFVVFSSGCHHHPKRILALPLSLTIVLAWFCISVLWSIEPLVALRRVALTVMIVWIVFKLVEDAGYEETLRVWRTMLVITLVLNYVSVFLAPAAIHQAGDRDYMDLGLVGGWHGILPHRNTTGPVCVITILLFAMGTVRIQPLLRWGMLIATAYFLYRTGSKTSMILLGPTLALGWIYRHYDRRYAPLLVLMAALVAIALVLVTTLYWEDLTAVFSRDDALSGRVQIWPVLLNYASDHWFFGAGYGSFWNIGPYSPVYKYTNRWVSGIAVGHNGYLDLLVTVGLAGVVVAVYSAVVRPILMIFSSRTLPRTQGAFLLCCIIFCAGNNMTETVLFERDVVVHVFLMVAVAMVGVATGQTQRRLSTHRRSALART